MELLEPSAREVEACVPTQLGSRFSRPQQTVVCSSWNNRGEATKSGPDFVVLTIGSGVACAGLSLNSLLLSW